jgi:hypothetical protein
VVKVQLLVLDIESPARFFAPVVTVTWCFVFAARILDESVGYGSSLAVLPWTLTAVGTNSQIFLREFHW